MIARIAPIARMALTSLIGLSLWLVADRTIAGFVQCEPAQTCPWSVAP